MKEDQLFWTDENRALFKTRRDLIKDINAVEKIPAVIAEQNPYRQHVLFLAAALNGGDYLLADPDLSDGERMELGLPHNEDVTWQNTTFPEVSGYDDLRLRITQSKNFTIGLFTSGTTGRPKCVRHHIETLFRAPLLSEAEGESHIIGFGFYPSHIAGVLLFMQGLMAGAPMVYLFETPASLTGNGISKHKITDLAATPTYLRALTTSCSGSASDSSPQTTLTGIFSGGEAFDTELGTTLKTTFPGVVCHNIYASTETGVLLISDGATFPIPKNLQSRIRITPDGELQVHRSLCADPEQTLSGGDWFATGDVVESVGEKRVVFVSRTTEMINAGGYKINPEEVEAALRTFPGITDAWVFGRPSRIAGTLVVAEVLREDAADETLFEEEITGFLKERLQEWKVPRIIRTVDSLDVTATGKKTRRKAN